MPYYLINIHSFTLKSLEFCSPGASLICRPLSGTPISGHFNSLQCFGEHLGIWADRMKKWNLKDQLRHAAGTECNVWDARATLKLAWNSFSPKETKTLSWRVAHNSQIARSPVSKSTSWYGNHKIYHLKLFVGVQVTKWTSQFGACGLRRVVEQI
jgi:hypothetical protein